MKVLWSLAMVMTGWLLAAAQLDAQRLIFAANGDLSLLFRSGEPLSFTLASPLGAYEITVRDNAGSVVYTGKGSGETFTIPAQPCGYYRITLKNSETEIANDRGFGVIAPRQDRRAELDQPSPYGVDMAVYNRLELNGDPMGGVKLLANVCDKLGVGFVRNRVVWELAENDKSGEFLRGTGEVARILRRRGIQSTVTFHDAPKRAKRTPDQVFPSDLLAVYEFCRLLSSTMPEVTGWEFWNEQDMLNGREFASAQKAAYLGFKAGNPKALVTPGSFFVYPFTQNAENMFRNQIGGYFDVFNYHVYLPLPEYPRTQASVRDLLTRYGLTAKPVWITESGTFADADSEIANGNISETAVQSLRQELLWAEFVPKAHILNQAGGAARSFTFCLRRIQENKRQWGLLRPDWSAKPAAVTLAVLNHELGDAVYLGELAAPADYRMFLYRQPDGSQSVAMWRTATLDRSHEKFLPKSQVGEIVREKFVWRSGDCSNVKMVNAFGAPVAAELKDGKLCFEVTNFVMYLHQLRGLEPVAKIPQLADAASAPAIGDKTVVLEAEPLAESGKLKLTVYNLSDQTKTGIINVSGSVTGLPASITLPPMGKATYELTAAREAAREIIFTPQFEGKTCSVLSITRQELGMFDEIAAPLFMTRDAWSENSSGKMTIALDPAQGTLVVNTVFASGVDRWSYPVFEAAKGGIDLADAYGIAFEMKEDAPVEAVERTKTYLCWIDGKRYPIAPSFGQWTECKLFFPEQPEKIKKISFGLNPRYDNLTFRLRNFRILR